MPRDILSIPGISAEVERVFSSAKFLIPPERSNLGADAIEAGECIRSWIKNGFFSLCSKTLNMVFVGEMEVQWITRSLRYEDPFSHLWLLLEGDAWDMGCVLHNPRISSSHLC
jgi:hypothetical protein